MGKAIIYQKNELVGPWGCRYLEERPHEKNRGRRALFKCGFCNNTFESEIQHVKKGDIKSCGCKAHPFKDLTNQKFGKLTVIRPTKKRQSKSIVWLCKCDCGNYKEVLQFNLTSGATTSCGCGGLYSKGEKLITSILTDLQIPFYSQKTFDDCRDISLLRFDFYLPDYNCCIEYDGIQHFKESTRFSDSLKDRQKRDQIKNEYCQNKNIKLIRIPYWDYDKLDKEYLFDKLENL